jgi:Peptidase family M23
MAALIGACVIPSLSAAEGSGAAGAAVSASPAASRGWSRLLRPGEIPPPPWPRRRPARDKRPWRGYAPPAAWPAEPSSPPVTAIDAEKLGGALRRLCGRGLKQATAQRYAGWMIEQGKHFGVDPFLIGAVIFHQSRCRLGKPRKRGHGEGLARIHAATHRRQLHEGRYRYWTLEQGAWKPRELDVSRFALTARGLRKGEASIYFTAALLSIYKQQCANLDAAVRSEPHRHPVSHFLWGDRVLGARFEDRVLRVRRLLLDDYTGTTPKARASYRGMPLFSPLDGVPLKVSSGFYDRRDRRRRHRGVDFVSVHGEPVRAVADGVVFFAGVDVPRRGARIVSPARSGRVRRSSMGRGGLFVLIQHGKGFASGYFHLASYTVAARQQVKGGQLIGYVGRTGIKESPAHLHFELRYQKRRFNPFHHLRPYLLPPTGHTEVRADKPKKKKKGKRGKGKLRRKRAGVVKLRRKAAKRSKPSR